MLDAFHANTVPIYWGNPLIGNDFNPKAFINCHDFDSFEAVVDRVREIDSNEDLYLSYLNEPAFIQPYGNEFIDEERILERFDSIFAREHLQIKAKRLDKIRYCFSLLLNLAMELPRRVKKKIQSAFFDPHGV